MAKKDDKDDDKLEIAQDGIMSKAELKACMALAKRSDPVNCAIAITKDKQGLILLDKKRRGKQLRAELKDKANELGIPIEATSLRFGKASVDTDIDSTLITFTVNKETSGAMRMPLLERVKKIGFTKLEITVNAALENESEQDDAAPAPPGAPAGASAAGAAPAGAASAGAASAGAAPAEAQAPPAAPPAPPPAPPSQASAEQAAAAKELTQKLMDLLKQRLPAVLAVTPGLKDGFLQIAEGVKGALQRGAIDIARDLVETLEDQLKAAPTEAAGGAAGGNGAAAQAIVTKAQTAWDACLRIADREVEKLRAEVVSAYRDHGFGTEVEKFFKAQIDPAMKRLHDNELATKLAAASKSGDAGERRQLLTEGVKIVEKLEGLVASDPVLKKLDNNPFTELVIARTATTTLGTLKKTLQSAVRV